MKKNFIYGTLLAVVAGATLTLASCSKDDDGNGGKIVVSIPSDSEATANPTLPEEANTTIPNLNYTVETENGQKVVRFDLTGIQDQEQKEWLYLLGTAKPGQNIWVEIDKTAKGFTVHNTIDDANQSTKQSLVDLVFLVDNSGSMDEEADTIAKDIVDWAKSLAKTLDMRFGCVGYDVSGYVNGALNFNDADSLARYLDRPGHNYWGTDRTMDFDDAALEEAADIFSHMYDEQGYVWDENGVMALRFAHEKFSFRPGANRVYVNFTDEPNQPNGNPEWSVEWTKDNKNWSTTYGTVHTVYSADTTWTSWRDLYNERPWRLSDYTGGTSLFVSSDFKGVSLESLPITGALQNSYYIRLTNVDNLFDGQEHTVKVTVLSTDKKVRAEREFKVVFQQ